ncbi:hypothetical protein PoB_006846200 [Plakobranchus ocellatus]|uniref:Uncharacterized protein n=1 Tax=Plakobranchus ocellatus TaxID=259542 RepID=A0AAV4DCI2_9GAST|nr:hypothetical protein PoB_006846200 [Plakobranchus ocellatus]
MSECGQPWKAEPGRVEEIDGHRLQPNRCHFHGSKTDMAVGVSLGDDDWSIPYRFGLWDVPPSPLSGGEGLRSIRTLLILPM